MEQFKIAKVVILPTNEVKGDFSKERIYPCLLKHSWMFDKEEKGKLIFTNSNIRTPTQLQNLYIILDKKPDNGDYYIIDGISEVLKNNGLKFIDDNCKKIIATTDTSLYIHQKETVSLPERVFYLPQPSQQFIEKYIEEYNKGNIITDVLVEYENVYIDAFDTKIIQHKKDSNSYLKQCTFINSTLKINPKDNTITIRKVKENYTKEEVISLCDDAYKVGYGTAVCEETNQGKEVSFKEWLSTSVLDIKPNKIYTKDEVIKLLERYISFLWKEISIHYPISLGNDVKDVFINREL